MDEGADSPKPPQELFWAASAFKVDAVTAEATSALADASIPCVVLKGPAIATWLYPGAEPRLYGDSDLLVRKADWDRTAQVVRGLGFEDGLGPLAHPRMESGSGYPWVRTSDDAHIDLHYTLFGIEADPDEVWAAFAEGAISQAIGGTVVSMPSRPARLLHIALHPVQHGGAAREKPMKDLELAIGKASKAEWLEACELAERLGASSAFASGLRLSEEGRALAERIGVEASEATLTALRLDSFPLAEGFHELAETPGAQAKLILILREVFPNPAFMRWWKPLANQGLGGLLLTYLWRPLWLAYRAVPGYIAWRRHRNRA